MRTLRTVTFFFLVIGLSTASLPAQASRRVKEFPIPTPKSYTKGITSGPDGALWLTETGANKIGTITTHGAITEYPVPSSGPEDIAAGPDGNLWFTEYGG